MAGRSLGVAPRDSTAEPVCLLTREWAGERAESPDAFLSMVSSEVITERGIEYRLPAGLDIWQRVEIFIREEGECCPFLGFDAYEDESGIRLKVMWPEEVPG